MFPRIYHPLKVLVLSCVVSIIFAVIFVKLYLNRHDAQLLQRHCPKIQLPRDHPHTSYHIDRFLSFRLQQIWSALSGPAKSGPPEAKYNVNVSVSDVIPFDREIAKTRNDACESIVYDENALPNLSFVIPFFNEPLSLLLRTLHSVLNRTPPKLLAEIVIVDDNSTYENLGEPLERYVSLLPKVILVRNKAREGLIRTRLIGLSKCTGEVVVFQDAHTEVNEGWAQPVLYHLKRHPNHLIQPAIDIIQPEDLSYSSGFHETSSAQINTFSWDLRYVWMDSPPRTLALRRSYADPVPTAAIVGCSIAVNRQYFTEIGSFDEKMNIWGGENLEVAMRYWLCGGAVLTHPCARVGHLFKPIPYTFGDAGGDQVVTLNLARVAEVWLDSYKKYFYATTWIWPQKRFNFTDDFIAEVANRRVQTKDRLHCKSFDWFLKAVTPEIKVPPRWAVWYGEVINPASKLCFQLLSCGHIGLSNECGWPSVKPQYQFYISTRGTLHYAPRDGACFTVEKTTSLLKASNCTKREVLQTYFTMASNNTWGCLAVFQSNKTMLCASVVNYKSISTVFKQKAKEAMEYFNFSVFSRTAKDVHYHHHEHMVSMVPCNPKDPLQMWYFIYRFQYKNLPEMLP